MTISIMHGETGKMFKEFFILNKAEAVKFYTNKQYSLRGEVLLFCFEILQEHLSIMLLAAHNDLNF